VDPTCLSFGRTCKSLRWSRTKSSSTRVPFPSTPWILVWVVLQLHCFPWNVLELACFEEVLSCSESFLNCCEDLLMFWDFFFNCVENFLSSFENFLLFVSDACRLRAFHFREIVASHFGARHQWWGCGGWSFCDVGECGRTGFWGSASHCCEGHLHGLCDSLRGWGYSEARFTYSRGMLYCHDHYIVRYICVYVGLWKLFAINMCEGLNLLWSIHNSN